MSKYVQTKTVIYMIRKEFCFLSDGTLLEMLFSNSQGLRTIKPEIDENAFGFFVQSEQRNEKNKRRKRILGSVLLYTILSGAIFLFSNTRLPLELLCILLVAFSVVFLFVRERFNSKNKKQKTYTDYREVFLSLIKKERVIISSTHEETFSALIIRVNMILGISIENKEQRLDEIISGINGAEDKFNKVFVIPGKLKSVLGGLRDFCTSQGIRNENFEIFIQRHAFSLTPKKKASEMETQSLVEELAN